MLKIAKDRAKTADNDIAHLNKGVLYVKAKNFRNDGSCCRGL